MFPVSKALLNRLLNIVKERVEALRIEEGIFQSFNPKPNISFHYSLTQPLLLFALPLHNHHLPHSTQLPRLPLTLLIPITIPVPSPFPLPLPSPHLN